MTGTTRIVERVHARRRSIRRCAPWVAMLGAGVLVGCARLGAIPPSPDLARIGADGPPPIGARRFDVGVDPEVPIRRSADGTLLVQPRINDVDVGWFAVDTGASGMLVDRTVIDAASLEPIGWVRLQGDARTTVYRAARFTLGPMELDDVPVAGVRFDSPWRGFARETEGVIGYEAFAGALVTLDLRRQRLGLRDPLAAATARADRQWAPLEIRRRLPFVRLRVEGGGEGLFLVDTGFAGGVWLFDQFVARHRLLDDRPTRSGRMLNYGSSTPVRSGALEWIEVAGQRVENVPTEFSTGPMALLAGDDAIDGIVGLDVLERFVVTVDYGGRRFALDPHAPDRGVAK